MNIKSLKKHVIAKYAFWLVAIAGLSIPIRANAQDCTAFVQNIVNNFGTIPTGYQGDMQVALITNRSDGHYVSYSEMPSLSGRQGDSGELVYHPGRYGLPPYLQGTLAQYFSDRRYSNGLGTDPFDPQTTDNLGILIYLGGYPRLGITAGEVVLTLNSWGGGKVKFPGQCQDGMINGFNGNTEFILSLFNQKVCQTGSSGC